jgi:hypothetical protein
MYTDTQNNSWSTYSKRERLWVSDTFHTAHLIVLHVYYCRHISTAGLCHNPGCYALDSIHLGFNLGRAHVPFMVDYVSRQQVFGHVSSLRPAGHQFIIASHSSITVLWVMRYHCLDSTLKLPKTAILSLYIRHVIWLIMYVKEICTTSPVPQS